MLNTAVHLMQAISDVERHLRRRAMLSSEETMQLLYRLCIRLGFCLPPETQTRIAESPPQDIDDFTVAVFHAEGLDPDTEDRQLYCDVRTMVADAFKQSANFSKRRIDDAR